MIWLAYFTKHSLTAAETWCSENMDRLCYCDYSVICITFEVTVLVHNLQPVSQVEFHSNKQFCIPLQGLLIRDSSRRLRQCYKGDYYFR
jgi:hypothetical protein